jgi:hypothetical protein
MPLVSSELLERLLHEEEGVALDFKSAQYSFANADDVSKSELLKDILAFANSWRRTDAYILIGVAEAKGSRSTVVRVASHLDDAQLQQFVNSKVQRPIHFSYTSLRVEGKDVAVIHIPLQERPFYLRRDFGRLTANTVYIRRGSSTDQARPDEIAQMGQSEASEPEFALEVFFADPARRERVEPVIHSLSLSAPPRREIPDYSRNRGPYALQVGRYSNTDYYRKLVSFTVADRLVTPLYLAIRNSGQTTAQDVRIAIAVAGADTGIVLMDDEEFPTIPQPEYDIASFSPNPPVRDFDVRVTRAQNTWIVEGRVDKVQPEATAWLRHPVYIGAHQSVLVTLEVAVFADNLPTPHRQSLSVRVESASRAVTLAEILELEEQRFGASPGHRAVLRKYGLLDDETEDDA